MPKTGRGDQAQRPLSAEPPFMLLLLQLMGNRNSN
jgi:hypothetical protein